jgi:hypothetical protein
MTKGTSLQPTPSYPLSETGPAVMAMGRRGSEDSLPDNANADQLRPQLIFGPQAQVSSRNHEQAESRLTKHVSTKGAVTTMTPFDLLTLMFIEW